MWNFDLTRGNELSQQNKELSNLITLDLLNIKRMMTIISREAEFRNKNLRNTGGYLMM